MKGEKMDRKFSFGNSMRKKFSDITDSVPRPKSQAISANFPQEFASVKEYMNHLVKEKMVLAKIVHEKNKVLESSGMEIQKLRTSLLTMRLHNWNLAQSNSQMLTELSVGREKMVGREYELRREVSESYYANRSRSTKIRSLSGTPLSQLHSDDKQAVGSNRRYCSRRRSASSRIQHQEPADIFYDIDYNTTFPIATRSNSSN